MKPSEHLLSCYQPQVNRLPRSSTGLDSRCNFVLFLLLVSQRLRKKFEQSIVANDLLQKEVVLSSHCSNFSGFVRYHCS